MTSPAPAPKTPQGIQNFGPGLLTIGSADVGTYDPDVSSLINGCTLTPSTDTADSTTKLSGYVRGGSSSTAWVLGGNTDTDAANANGFWQFCFDNDGAEVPFTFVAQYPGPRVTGRLKVTALPWGADEYGADLTADFEFPVVGKPEVDRTGAAAAMRAAVPEAIDA